MEKRKPSYDLEAIKAQFREPAGYKTPSRRKTSRSSINR
jgi:hypothetical protein